jgi:hypothetical protein
MKGEPTLKKISKWLEKPKEIKLILREFIRG